MPFLDIMYQAELSRYEDPDFLEYAKKNCNELPETRNEAIKELRRLIQDRGECNPHRTDDAYLLRFLRCRRFVPPLAHKLMVRYEQLKRNYPHLYECNPFHLERVKHIYGAASPDSPDNGRITLMRFGRWDSEATPAEDVVRCALIMDELASLQPRLQILGVTIIVDLEGLSMRHLKHLTPSLAHQIVSLMGVSFPIMIHSLHVVKYNWLLNTFFYIFKQFIPRAAWDRLYFHGYDMSSLHKHIDPKYLPTEYGGTCETSISSEEWLRKINMYKDDFLTQELSDLGYNMRDASPSPTLRLLDINYFNFLSLCDNNNSPSKVSV